MSRSVSSTRRAAPARRWGPVALGLLADWVGLAVTFRVAALIVVAVALTFWVLATYAEKVTVTDSEYSSVS